jgi:hypothetical protein
MFIITIFLLSLNIYGADIDCDDTTCSIDATLTVDMFDNSGSRTNYVIKDNLDDIRVQSLIGPPRSTNLVLDNNLSFIPDVIVDLSSIANTADSADFLLIADEIDSLSISLNGRNGEDGLDANEICATNFKDSSYGADSKVFFDNRRIADPSLSNLVCDITDIEYIRDNKFSCPTNHSEVFTDTTSVERIKFKRKCSGITQYTRCAKRSRDISCRTNLIKGTGCCNSENTSSKLSGLLDSNNRYIMTPVSWSCSPLRCASGNETGWSTDLLYRILEYDALGKTDSQICEEQTLALPSPVAFYDSGPTTSATYTNSGSLNGNNVHSSGTYINDNQIKLPLFDTIIAPNNTTPSVTSGDVRLVFKNLSGLDLSNCFGMNGSSNTDNDCLRTKGAAGSVDVAYVGEYGKISNYSTINIPEGKKKMCTNYTTSRLIRDSARFPSINGTLSLSWPTINYDLPNLFHGGRNYFHLTCEGQFNSSSIPSGDVYKNCFFQDTVAKSIYETTAESTNNCKGYLDSLTTQQKDSMELSNPSSEFVQSNAFRICHKEKTLVSGTTYNVKIHALIPKKICWANDAAAVGSCPTTLNSAYYGSCTGSWMTHFCSRIQVSGQTGGCTSEYLD